MGKPQAAQSTSTAVVRVIEVREPLTLRFADGTEIRIEPARNDSSRLPAIKFPHRPTKEVLEESDTPKPGRGRKPSPATVTLKGAMEGDRRAGKVRNRAHYLRILREAGHKGSDASAYLIVSREAKRVFGKNLPKGKAAKAAGRRNLGGAKRGRPLPPETRLLREKLQQDKASGTLGDAKHYVAWLMDQESVKVGMKRARPIVYRELRAVKA